jgi:hypothetical protein
MTLPLVIRSPVIMSHLLLFDSGPFKGQFASVRFAISIPCLFLLSLSLLAFSCCFTGHYSSCYLQWYVQMDVLLLFGPSIWTSKIFPLILQLLIHTLFIISHRVLSNSGPFKGQFASVRFAISIRCLFLLSLSLLAFSCCFAGHYSSCYLQWYVQMDVLLLFGPSIWTSKIFPLTADSYTTHH